MSLSSTQFQIIQHLNFSPNVDKRQGWTKLQQTLNLKKFRFCLIVIILMY